MVQQLSPSQQRPDIHYLRLLGYCFRFYIPSNHVSLSPGWNYYHKEIKNHIS